MWLNPQVVGKSNHSQDKTKPQTPGNRHRRRRCWHHHHHHSRLHLHQVVATFKGRSRSCSKWQVAYVIAAAEPDKCLLHSNKRKLNQIRAMTEEQNIRVSLEFKYNHLRVRRPAEAVPT